MKKVIWLFVLAALCAGCVPDPEDIRYSSVWRVENGTVQTLTITPGPGGEQSAYLLAPGEGVDFYTRQEQGYCSYLLDMLVCWRGVPPEKIAFKVLDVDGKSLKQWDFMDGEGNVLQHNAISGKHFFNDYSWEDAHDRDKRKKKYYRWTFTIFPEDIQPQTEP
jgi:hypothetical protein